MLFVKHIEGDMSKPEQAIDEKLGGKLSVLLREQEQESEILFSTGGGLPAPWCCAVVFHRADLPFSYSSVDAYARKLLSDVAAGKQPGEEVQVVATAVHGPGAGLDASEALETMVMALANELQQLKQPGGLREILFVEQDRDIFQRLQERLNTSSTVVLCPTLMAITC